jgi:Protein of unknown function (DUF2470)
MSDLEAFAQRARTALAEAASATLLVHGIGRCGRHDAAVVLHERDGRPRLICDSGSPVSAAARAARSALLSVASEPDGTVLFSGTLVLEEIQNVDGAVVDVVGMRLDSVLLEREDDSGPVVHYELPLDVYFGCGPDVIAQYAARVLAHTNHAHAEQIRRFAAHHGCVAETAIAAARVTALDAQGVRVEWVDERGGHSVRADFPAAATTPAQLALALRDHLGE